MQQTFSQLTLKQKFTFQATCVKGFRLKRICISKFCECKNIYLCGKSEDTCQCHYQHKSCPSINYSAFCERFSNYKNELNSQVQDYVQRFEKVFNNLQNKIKKQAQLFKSHYENLLFGDIKSSIKRKIQNKNINALTSFEVSNFLKSLQNDSKQINCGKLSLNEAHQLDKKIAQLFSFIQNLYQNKIIKKAESNKQKPMRSYSSVYLQNKSSSVQRSNSQLKNSSYLQEKYQKSKNVALISNYSKQIFSQNLSTLLEKKTINDYFEDKFNQFKPPKINLDYPKSISSKIIQNCSMINYFIGKKIQSYELFFRASQHNFQIKDFYKQVQKSQNIKDQKTELQGYLFLIKSEFNNVFGAFTQLSFSDLNKKISQINNLKNESESESQLNPEQSKLKKRKKNVNDIKSLTFIFSLNLKQKYHLKDPQKAFYIGSNSFGFGNTDLRIRNKSHLNRESYCKIGDSFKLIQKSKNFCMDYDRKNLKIIGSRYGKKFKIIQWQCFKVNYSKQNY